MTQKWIISKIKYDKGKIHIKDVLEISKQIRNKMFIRFDLNNNYFHLLSNIIKYKNYIVDRIDHIFNFFLFVFIFKVIVNFLYA